MPPLKKKKNEIGYLCKVNCKNIHNKEGITIILMKSKHIYNNEQDAW